MAANLLKLHFHLDEYYDTFQIEYHDRVKGSCYYYLVQLSFRGQVTLGSIMWKVAKISKLLSISYFYLIQV